MTVQQLLNDRYKLEVNYPNSELDDGAILHKHTFNNGNYCYVTNQEVLLLGKSKRFGEVEGFPKLFCKLEWWEEREEKDMPEYLKLVFNNRIQYVHKIISWEGENYRGQPLYNYINKVGSPQIACISELIPATEAEYANYLNTQNK